MSQFWPRPKKVPVYRQEGFDWFVYLPLNDGGGHKRYITLEALRRDHPTARPSRLGQDPLANAYRSGDPKKMAAREKRDAVHTHNGLIGATAMAKTNMQRIIDSRTATSAAKQVAQHIHGCLETLQTELKTRKPL